MLTSPNSKATLSLWHSRLGHPSSPILNTIISTFSLPVLSSSQKVLSCHDCLINKSHKLPFSQSTISSSRPLEYLFSDVWSSPILSHDNFKYYLIIIDHYTRYTWLYPLKQKSQVKETFIAFKNLVENKFQAWIGTFYFDNGGEFLALKAYFSAQGISHHTSPPHTPEHNGISERKHRHVVETGLTLLSQASVPKTYWPYAFAVAVYLINRLPTPVLSTQSPFQKLFGRSPNYSNFRIFGCACFPWLRPYNNHKLDDRSLQCVFLGYSLTQSAYYCLHIPSGRIYVSRHVQFDESSFPFSTTVAKSSPVNIDASPPLVHWPPYTSLPVHSSAPPQGNPCSDLHRTTPSSSSSSRPSSPPSQVLPSLSRTSSVYPSSEPTAPNENGPQLTAQHQTSPTNQSPSHTTTSTHSSQSPLNSTEHQNSETDTQTQSVTHHSSSSSSSHQPPPVPINPANNHSMATRGKQGVSKPNPKYLYATTTLCTSNPEPRTAIQALKDERWRKAMTSEINAQLQNHTWDIVPPPPPTTTIVGCRWIFTTKYNPDGSINRHKARLIAKGYNQREGVDYAETFSPVIKSTTIRTVLGVAVDYNWPIRQLDVNNAFLQGTLEDEVYMTQPPGFVDADHPNYVCRLRKALYGLKQAPRAWYIELRNFLLQAGFINSVADTSLFILKKGRSFVYMLVYVDDILVTGNDNELLQYTLDAIANTFSVKDHEDLHYFLGIEAKRGPFGLHLSQRKYTLDILARTNMLGAKPIMTPMATTPKLTLHSGTRLSDPTEYRAVVGSLQYLAMTRPDISYAVNQLSQFMHEPTSDHWLAVKRVLRFLAATYDHGILLCRGSTLSLHAYSDADWAGDSDDYVSTNGHIVYLGKHPISWSSKKQKSIARSSTEAEYKSVANTSSELTWICSLLHELGIKLPTALVIYCDNVGATYLCANPVFHSRMKHVALDYHFIRNQVQSGALRVVHVSTKDQLADTLTKPLPRATFTDFSTKIGVSRAPSS